MINAVIDLSHWNRDSDIAWENLIPAGVLGVFHKATQRDVDEKYHERHDIALHHGLLWGAYHFGDSGSGADQANFFLDTVQPDLATLVALDWESRAMSLVEAEAFCQTVFDRLGRWPMIYGGSLLKENMQAVQSSVLANCPLWIAHYGVDKPVVPLHFSTWQLWQYGNEPRIPGCGRLGREWFTGTADELIRLWKGGFVVEKLLADRFIFPLVHIEEWYLSNPYLNKYDLGYHTGADWLKRNTNVDYGAPVLACANGTVTFSDVIYRRDGSRSSWGHVIVIRHDLPNGKTVWSRSAHVLSDKVRVKAGDVVEVADVIAYVGNADGYYSMAGTHLHFDIAVTDDLEKNPGHWPGLNYNEAKRVYANPITFIRDHLVVEEKPPMAETKMKTISALNMRWTPSTLGLKLGTLPKGATVTLLGKQAVANGLQWEAVIDDATQRVAWVAKDYLTANP